MVWGLEIETINVPQYKWDSWSAADYVLGDISDLPEGSLEISTSARMALTIAIAEIVLFRLLPFDTNRDAQHWITASWAFLLPESDVEALLSQPPEEKGPGLEPIRLICTILHDMQRAEGGVDRSFTLIWMHNLAAHVLSDLENYEGWFLEVLNRLKKHHLEPKTDIFEESFQLGKPVERCLFDVSKDYTFDPTHADLADYVRENATENPYIMGIN